MIVAGKLTVDEPGEVFTIPERSARVHHEHQVAAGREQLRRQGDVPAP